LNSSDTICQDQIERERKRGRRRKTGEEVISREYSLDSKGAKLGHIFPLSFGKPKTHLSI